MKKKKIKVKRSKKKKKKEERNIELYYYYYHIMKRSQKQVSFWKKKKKEIECGKVGKKSEILSIKRTNKIKMAGEREKKLDKINKTECWKQTKQTWRKMRGRGSWDASISQQQRSVKVLFLWFLFDSLMILFSFLFHWLICISCFKTRFFLHLCFL